VFCCLSIPFFAAAVERRNDRSLAKKPIVAGGQPWEPRPVFGFSQEAAQKGVAPGLLLRQAHVFAPQAQFIAAHPRQYSQVSLEVADLLADYSPRVEPADLWHPPARPQPNLPLGGRSLPAQYYLELGDLPAAEALRLAREIGGAVRQEADLAPAIGLAEQRFTAHVAAARARAEHIQRAPGGGDGSFLAGCSVNYLPLEGEIHRRLHLLGVHTLGELAALPLTALQSQFGPAIKRLHALARGDKEGPLPARAAEPVEQVEFHFEEPLEDRQAVGRLLEQAATELAERLAEGALLGQELRWRWEMGKERAGQDRLALRQASGERRRLAAALAEMAERVTFASGITAMTVSLSGLRLAQAGQLSLFAQQEGSGRQASEAARKLAAKHGLDCFYEVVLATGCHPLPERRFQLQPYDPALE
jgi:nucleotidyltransferase/DNA polymerase involved in DNA repair